jgi:hypothetical protein
MKNLHIFYNMHIIQLTGFHGVERPFAKAKAEDKPVFLSIGYS